MMLAAEPQQGVAIRRKWRGRAAHFGCDALVVEYCIPCQIWQKYLQESGQAANFPGPARKSIHQPRRTTLQRRNEDRWPLFLRVR